MPSPAETRKLPPAAQADAAGRILLTPYDMGHAEYVGRAFDQIRVYAAGHPQVLVALVRTQRMLRGVCLLAGRTDHVVAALDRRSCRQ